MSSSNATSPAPPPRQAPRQSTGRSSSPSAPTPTSAEQFSLGGPSAPPDPATHAYRQDLADVRLAGQVIASHYAAGVDRVVTGAAVLRSAPAAEAEAIVELAAGEPFELLDDTRGWAWGYAGENRLVGYVESRMLSP